MNNKDIYKANEADVSDEALARSRQSARKARIAQKIIDRERRNAIAVELWGKHASGSGVRQKNKVRLYELWCENNFSWVRAKKLLKLEKIKKENYVISDALLEQYKQEIQREFPTAGNGKVAQDQGKEILDKAIAKLEDIANPVQYIYAANTIASTLLKYLSGKINLEGVNAGLVHVGDNVQVNTTTNNNTIQVNIQEATKGQTDDAYLAIAEKFGVTVKMAKGMAQEEKKRIQAEQKAIPIETKAKEVIEIGKEEKNG